MTIVLGNCFKVRPMPRMPRFQEIFAALSAGFEAISQINRSSKNVQDRFARIYMISPNVHNEHYSHLTFNVILSSPLEKFHKLEKEALQATTSQPYFADISEYRCLRRSTPQTEHESVMAVDGMKYGNQRLTSSIFCHEFRT